MVWRMRLITICLLLIFSLPVQAQVYRWVDSHGVTHYSDTPHRKTAKPVKLPTLQTYRPAKLPATERAGTQEKTKVEEPPVAPRIVKPRPKATIRDAQLRVSVDVNAALKPQQGLLYELDGQPQNNTPTRKTHYRLHDVFRGSHTITVVLTDASGAPLAKSKPVTIYMKPPTVHH